MRPFSENFGVKIAQERNKESKLIQRHSKKGETNETQYPYNNIGYGFRTDNF